MEKIRSIKNNIIFLTIIKYSKWFMLYMPVVIIFYINNQGFSMKEILLLQSIYSVSMLIFEVPSGYSADVLGRRFTLIVGTTLGFAGFSMYAFSDFFWQFAVAEVIMGIGMSFVSGADSAMLYDSLYDIQKQEEYSKYEGRVTATGNFAEALAGVTGGILTFYFIKIFPEMGRQSIFLAQALVAFTGVPAAILLIEPRRHTIGKKEAFKNILKISKYALYDSAHLKFTIYFSALIGAATLTMAWFVQKIFLDLNITNEKHLGYLWALLNVVVGIFTLLAHRIDRKIGNLKTMLLLASAISLGYISLIFDSSYYSLIIIFIFYCFRGIATPVLKDYINRITSSEIRATILSLRSLIIRIIFAFIAPLIGWMSDINLRHALFYAGIFFMIISFYLWFKLNKIYK